MRCQTCLPGMSAPLNGGGGSRRSQGERDPQGTGLTRAQAELHRGGLGRGAPKEGQSADHTPQGCTQGLLQRPWSCVSLSATLSRPRCLSTVSWEHKLGHLYRLGAVKVKSFCPG